jgi:cysteinyl-tRNA synthetase
VSDADEGEDKMMKALRREGLEPSSKSLLKLADQYTRAFQNDLTLLNITPPHKWTKATDHIPEMIALIERIQANDLAYETADGVYFDTAKFSDYGKMANLDKARLQAGARVEVNKEKHSPSDFVLWIKAVGDNAQHVMQWSSPWGVGFPGWHIECSAMSMKYLGEHFDIHAGGVDHIPVHHTNEIAQNQGAVGHRVVERWLHGEFLVLDKAKMAKSGEGFITLQTLTEKGFEPLAYRYFCLQTHYRQKLSFSWEAVEAAENALINVWAIVGEYDLSPIGCAEYEVRFLEAINDDLNTPKALAVMWDLLKDKEMPAGAKKRSLLKFDTVLGLGLAEIKQIKIPGRVKKLVQERQSARDRQAWAEADQLRQQIAAEGFNVEDTPAGPVVKKGKST